MDDEEQIKLQILNLQNQLNKIAEKQKEEKMKLLIWKCFKYKSNYDGHEIYFRVLKNGEVFKFELDTYNHFQCCITHYESYKEREFTEITEKDLEEAYAKIEYKLMEMYNAK